ncbi:MAG: alpha-D-glucose phosphate-specific phosphoglucomutase [Rhabdochlamydiaceae bacterium]
MNFDEKNQLDLPALINAYYNLKPDPYQLEQQIVFGTSGHRGSSLNRSFNETHILAIVTAICEWRQLSNINGPLFLGADTHALSEPCFKTALEVLIFHKVSVKVDKEFDATPTPVISHAILTHNHKYEKNLADGLIITPSHNPPEEGGIKYNSTHGGPAEQTITNWIQKRANELLLNPSLYDNRVSFDKALSSSYISLYDYKNEYVNDLDSILDMELIKRSPLKVAVDPLGGAGVNYWPLIAEKYHLNLTITNQKIDKTFSFMPPDWDGKIRMDPSSKEAMKDVINQTRFYDLILACDTDHDRHGIITKTQGLIPSNQYLSSCIFYLLSNRPLWGKNIKIGKTMVSSSMIDIISCGFHKQVYETAVGFKWFSQGLKTAELGFAGEESAGSSFLKKDGSCWSTDKDGIIAALLAVEMSTYFGKDPSEIYSDIEAKYGAVFYRRKDSPLNKTQKEKLKKLSKETVTVSELAGDPVTCIQDTAPGDNIPLGGLKIKTKNGWVAVRPSGTEEICKLYAESSKSEAHLELILNDSQSMLKKMIE